MKRAKLFFCFAILCHIGISQVLYPEVYSSFGGHSVGSTIQLTWTAGEPLFETATNANSILTQGFNQVLHVIASDVDMEPGDAKFQVFPNPCKDNVWIEFSLLNEDKTLLKLFDLSGNILLISPMKFQRELINVSHLASGLYIYKIYNMQNQLLKTGKIVKAE